jgi:hypothetical protein
LSVRGVFRFNFNDVVLNQGFEDETDVADSVWASPTAIWHGQRPAVNAA